MKTKNWKKQMTLTGLVISMVMLAACQPEAAKGTRVPGAADYETVPDSTGKGGLPDSAGKEGLPDSAGKGGLPDGAGKEEVPGSADAPQGSGTFYDGADLEGSVVRFTDTGCSISPVKSECIGEGEILEEAAPGSEDLSQLVEIMYGDKCQFQIITLDAAAQKEVSREEAAKEDIKKATEILVFGSSREEGCWTAEKVAIMRWQ